MQLDYSFLVEYDLLLAEYTFTIAAAELSNYVPEKSDFPPLRYPFYSVLCLAGNFFADKIAYSKLELIFES